MLLRHHDAANLAAECARCGVRSASVCAVVPDEDIEQLATYTQHLEFEAGQTFINQDEPAQDFFVVTEGHARLCTLMPDGRRQVTGFAAPGQFLGLAADGNYAFNAEALTPLKLCRVTRHGLKLLMSQFPQLEQRLLTEASRELSVAQGRMLLLGRKTARERLASFLTEHAGMAACRDVIVLPMTRTDIADYLGLTIETVSRTLNALRRDGLIEIDHITRIRLLDRPALEDIAAGGT